MAGSKWLRFALVGAGLLFALAATAQAGTYINVGSGDYTGTRSVGSGLTGTGDWMHTDDVKIDYTISLSASGYYIYEYVISVVADHGSVSHFAIEVSDVFTKSDIVKAFADGVDVTSTKMSVSSNDDQNWPGTSNPNNLKWDIAATTYTLYTYRTPVWGDVFIKNGVGDAYNTGINTDPIEGTTTVFTNWVPVPDTAVVPLPMAAVAGLGMLGVLAAARLNRRRSGI